MQSLWLDVQTQTEMMHTQGWETQKAPTCLYVLNYMSSADTERSLDADPPPYYPPQVSLT